MAGEAHNHNLALHPLFPTSRSARTAATQPRRPPVNLLLPAVLECTCSPPPGCPSSSMDASTKPFASLHHSARPGSPFSLPPAATTPSPSSTPTAASSSPTGDARSKPILAQIPFADDIFTAVATRPSLSISIAWMGLVLESSPLLSRTRRHRRQHGDAADETPPPTPIRTQGKEETDPLLVHPLRHPLGWAEALLSQPIVAALLLQLLFSTQGTDRLPPPSLRKLCESCDGSCGFRRPGPTTHTTPDTRHLLVLDVFLVLAAPLKSRGSLVTRTVHSELVFHFSSSKNVGYSAWFESVHILPLGSSIPCTQVSCGI